MEIWMCGGALGRQTHTRNVFQSSAVEVWDQNTGEESPSDIWEEKENERKKNKWGILYWSLRSMWATPPLDGSKEVETFFIYYIFSKVHLTYRS